MNYGYQSILLLEEESIPLENCSYSFLRDINEKTGEVQSLVLEGVTYVGYSSYPSDNIWNWALHYKFKNGKIGLRNTDLNKGSFIPEAEMTFQNAACVGLKLNYTRAGGTHFYTQLTITSDNSVIGDTDDWVKKNWLLNE